MLFLEHVRSEDSGSARWQDRLERPWRFFGAGCHCNRDTVAAIGGSPLEIEEPERDELPKAPPIVRPLIRGSAVLPGLTHERAHRRAAASHIVGEESPEERREMPTYVMLTNLTPEGVRTLKNNPNRVTEVNKEVEAIGVKVLAQYATLGRYDFVTIVEAPDDKTMAKVSVELGSRGTMTSQTLAAMPAEELAGAAL